MKHRDTGKERSADARKPAVEIIRTIAAKSNQRQQQKANYGQNERESELVYPASGPPYYIHKEF
jgi:hypothetical protein